MSWGASVGNEVQLGLHSTWILQWGGWVFVADGGCLSQPTNITTARDIAIIERMETLFLHCNDVKEERVQIQRSSARFSPGLVGPPGFEPGQEDPKSSVLPLHYGPVGLMIAPGLGRDNRRGIFLHRR